MVEKERTQNNPNSEDNYSYDQMPSGGCAAYYILTVLYILFVLIAVIVVTVIFLEILFPEISYKMELLFLATQPITYAAVLMFLYAYFCIGVFKLRKPDSMFGLYLPVLLYLFWQLLLWIAFNFYMYGGQSLLFGMLSLNFYGAILSEYHWNCMQLLNWIYNLALLGGFAAGERLAFRRRKIVRKPFNRKRILLALLCSGVLLLWSERVFLYGRRNIIASDSEQSGYGFAYENGYSSTDLEPYYVENEENILAKLNEPSELIITDPSQMPVLDGAEAAYPIYSAFANACYQDIGEIQGYAKNNLYRNPDIPMPIKFNNTIIAFEDLVAGETDIFFGAQPSRSQRFLAAQAGKQLVMTPIAREAFIFFVNSENPVDGLTADQLRDIYSGKIDNWKHVGGKNKRILAFQRPENSGSQTMMKYFMNNIPLKEPLETEYVGSMGALMTRTASYQNRSTAIGYSFRYFASIMAKDTANASNIKYLSVDGVYPDTDTIRSEEYPVTTELYAVTLADNPNENVNLFLEWMTDAQGQQIVADTGYVAYKK